MSSEVESLAVETSFPSTVNIGTEIGYFVKQGKPVVCLYENGRQSVFTSEVLSNRLIEGEYNEDDLEKVLEWGLKEAEQMLNRRFTMFITPEIDCYLNEISKQGGSRSEFIRNLIRKKMEKKWKCFLERVAEKGVTKSEYIRELISRDMESKN